MLRRRIMMAQGEGVPYGCYIQDTTGKLWKAGTWDGSATFNGIAVHTEECSFVTKRGASLKSMYKSSSKLSSSFLEYHTEALAKADYDGEGNTALLVSGASNAKLFVEDNPFPDGTIGYIPSLGELYTLYEHKDEASALFEEATGATMIDIVYRSSTMVEGAGGRGRNAYFWTIDFLTGNLWDYVSADDSSVYIRSFCKLNI